jgi:hypothetical protein
MPVQPEAPVALDYDSSSPGTDQSDEVRVKPRRKLTINTKSPPKTPAFTIRAITPDRASFETETMLSRTLSSSGTPSPVRQFLDVNTTVSPPRAAILSPRIPSPGPQSLDFNTALLSPRAAIVSPEPSSPGWQAQDTDMNTSPPTALISASLFSASASNEATSPENQQLRLAIDTMPQISPDLKTIDEEKPVFNIKTSPTALSIRSEISEAVSPMLEWHGRQFPPSRSDRFSIASPTANAVRFYFEVKFHRSSPDAFVSLYIKFTPEFLLLVQWILRRQSFSCWRFIPKKSGHV